MILKMKNKVELKKALILSIVAVFITSLIFIFISYKEYKSYTNNFNEKLSMIINGVIEKYPDVDKNEIMNILNSKTSSKYNLLREYGIDLDKDSLIIENDNNFDTYLIINVCIILILSVILIIIFLHYNRNKNRKLKEILNYVEEINKKNYKLDIDDNSEDELSILKNELYKTTVMLKEVAENSMNDKINLKNSLSDISHQLKTPLTSILIMLDNILDDKNMSENIREDFIKDIKREIINIKFLVEALLKLSKKY